MQLGSRADFSSGALSLTHCRDTLENTAQASIAAQPTTTETSFIKTDPQQVFTYKQRPTFLFEEDRPMETSHQEDDSREASAEGSRKPENTQEVDKGGFFSCSQTTPGGVSSSVASGTQTVESQNIATEQDLVTSTMDKDGVFPAACPKGLVKHIEKTSKEDDTTDKQSVTNGHHSPEPHSGNKPDLVPERHPRGAATAVLQGTDQASQPSHSSPVTSVGCSEPASQRSIVDSVHSLSGVLPVSGSLVDITTLLQRVVDFGQVLAQTLYPLRDFGSDMAKEPDWIAAEEAGDVDTRDQSARRDLLAARTQLYENTIQVSVEFSRYL